MISMVDGIVERRSWRRSMSYSPGDCVRIRNGPLAGLTGVVTEVNATSKCTLVIDGLVRGVYLVAPRHVLERREGTTLGAS